VRGLRQRLSAGAGAARDPSCHRGTESCFDGDEPVRPGWLSSPDWAFDRATCCITVTTTTVCWSRGQAHRAESARKALKPRWRPWPASATAGRRGGRSAVPPAGAAAGRELSLDDVVGVKARHGWVLRVAERPLAADNRASALPQALLSALLRRCEIQRVARPRRCWLLRCACQVGSERPAPRLPPCTGYTGGRFAMPSYQRARSSG
jgi:hypothetical protein